MKNTKKWYSMIFVENYTFYIIINNVFKQITKRTRTDAPRRYAVWNAPRSIQKGICIFCSRRWSVQDCISFAEGLRRPYAGETVEKGQVLTNIDLL